jgi:hypothetical protein
VLEHRLRRLALLRQLRSIRRYVSVPVCQLLVTSLVLTRLGFCNSVAFGLPAVRLRRLRAVQYAALRLIFSLRRTEHISDALMCIHWLRVADRVRFRMAMLVFNSLHGFAPLYLTSIFTPLFIVSHSETDVSYRVLALVSTNYGTLNQQN